VPKSGIINAVDEVLIMERENFFVCRGVRRRNNKEPEQKCFKRDEERTGEVMSLF
jgi:hypothetical protein